MSEGALIQIRIYGYKTSSVLPLASHLPHRTAFELTFYMGKGEGIWNLIFC